MAGTKIGARRMTEVMYAKYGRDYYRKLGAIGGKLSHTGGFYANRELARIAGAKGGRISRRGKAIPA